MYLIHKKSSGFFSGKTFSVGQLLCCALATVLLSSCVTMQEWEQRQQRIVTELRQNPHLMVTPLEAGAISAQVRSGISFQLDSMAPTTELHGVLDHVIHALRDNSADYKIVVVGHTDNIDPKNRNNTNYFISSTRAALVARYLVQKGIDRSLVSHEGKGPDHPLVDNETEEGRNVNRRIELQILPILKAITATSNCSSPFCPN